MSYFRRTIKMQIHIRGQNNHVLEVQPTETIGEIKVSTQTSKFNNIYLKQNMCKVVYY